MIKIRDLDVQQINAALQALQNEVQGLLNDGVKVEGQISLIERNVANIDSVSHATTAGTADFAESANIDKELDTVNGDYLSIGTGEGVNVTNAVHAVDADNATEATHATTADTATTATTADSATNADHATNADTATYAETSGGAAPVFPEGYIYMQLYNPSTSTWEKAPAQMGLQIPSGYKWTEITANFSSYPYLKIGTGTTQPGHNAYHNHGGYTGYSNPRHSHGLQKNVPYGLPYNNTSGVGVGVGGGVWYGESYAPFTVLETDINHRHTISYDGNSTEQTVEVNASGVKIWKVVVDA